MLVFSYFQSFEVLLRTTDVGHSQGHMHIRDIWQITHSVCWTVLNVLWRAVEDITSFRKKLLCCVLFFLIHLICLLIS